MKFIPIHLTNGIVLLTRDYPESVTEPKLQDYEEALLDMLSQIKALKKENSELIMERDFWEKDRNDINSSLTYRINKGLSKDNLIKNKIKELIEVYSAEVKLSKDGMRFFKGKNNITYNVAEQRNVSYSRVIEDLNFLLKKTVKTNKL